MLNFIKEYKFFLIFIVEYISLMITKIFILVMIGISNALVTDFSEEITDNIFKNSSILWISRRALLDSGHNIYRSQNNH